MDTLLSWCSANLLCIALILLVRRYLLLPLTRIVQQLHRIQTVMTQEKSSPVPIMLNIRVIAREVARFSLIAQDYYRKHQEVSHALEEARSMLASITVQQSTLLASTNREISLQYQSVLAYANYLEDHISRTAADPTLRYDFDDVCESSFNLKLIAGAMQSLHGKAAPLCAPVSIAELMQQTMLALAPSLDRRSMKLTTAEVDTSVIAFTDACIIAQVLWMMLLGTIRYAADESTLRMRCLYNRDRTHALVSIVVSELSPGMLSEEERSAHMVRQLQRLTPHMFAETIRIHANIQLAELLLKQLQTSISILPLTSRACEICLILPRGMI